MFAKRLIGIDIGSQDIKLVEILKSGGGVRLLSAERVRLPGNGADLTAKMESAEEAIRSFLATRRRVPVVCSVPPQDATEKVVDLPPTDPDTVDDVMRFEAETHIPLPLDTVNFDHAVVRADPQGTSVLLAACPRHVLGALQNALLKAGAKRFALETPCVALLNALRQATPEDVLTTTPGLLLVDIGAQHTQVIVLANGQPRIVRALPIGGEGLTEGFCKDYGLSIEAAEERKRGQGLASEEDLTPAVQAWLQHLGDELRRVIQGFRALTRTGTIERVLLSGGGALTPGLVERLRERVGVPVQLLPTEGAITASVSSLEAAGRESIRFATAIGLALSANGGALAVNLLPQERKRQLSQVVPRPLMLGIIAGVIAAVVLVTAGQRSFNAEQKDRLKSLKSQLRDVNPSTRFKSAPSAASEMRKVTALKQLAADVRKDSDRWLDILRQLSAQLPPKVSISEITMEKQRSVVVRGIADSNDTVAESLRVLREMPHCTNVRLDYAAGTQIEAQPAVDFQIVCRLPAPVVERRRGR